jgi:UDP-N-acetylglucosamine acyltransferase
MSSFIHPTAIVSAEAQLAGDVQVGPFAIIEGPVVLGAGCRVGPHVHLMGHLTIGENNTFHTGCVIGDAPQHSGYKGEPTRVEIGDGNTFREYCTVHRGMPAPATGVTTIGDRNLMMANSHVGHDCRVGNGCVTANGSMLGGHVELQDGVFVSGNAAVHQFCRVGRLAMIGGLSAVSQDCPPFWMIRYINVPHGINVVGMKRSGMNADDIAAVRRAYKTINRERRLISNAVEVIEAADGHRAPIRELIDFIRSTKRGIVVGSLREGPDE